MAAAGYGGTGRKQMTLKQKSRAIARLYFGSDVVPQRVTTTVVPTETR